MKKQFAEKERAEEVSRSYTKRIETLHGIDRAILEARSPERFADAAICRIRELMPCLHALIGVFEPEGDVIIIAAYCESETELRPGMRISAGDFEVAAELERDRVQRVDNALNL